MMVYNKVFVVEGEAFFVYHGVSSRKQGANIKPICDPPLRLLRFTRLTKTFSAFPEVRCVTWT